MIMNKLYSRTYVRTYLSPRDSCTKLLQIDPLAKRELDSMRRNYFRAAHAQFQTMQEA